MNKTELRIGNIIRDIESGRIGTVLTLGAKKCTVKMEFSKLMQDYDEFEPIPLSGEWLLKMGFENKKDGKFYHSKFDRTWVSLDSILVKWYGNALGGIMMLDYVHQLQNIFFSLTGEELTVKQEG